jgi:hypothetical protein
MYDLKGTDSLSAHKVRNKATFCVFVEGQNFNRENEAD